MTSPVRTQQEANTSLEAATVLIAAADFFATRNGIYSAFPEKAGPTFVSLRGQGGEEVIFGVEVIAGGTRVTGSSYIFDQQIARFLSTLPPYIAPLAPLAPLVSEALPPAAPSPGVPGATPGAPGATPGAPGA